MPEIVTRWEWRTFGPRLKSAEAWLAAQQSTGVQESDEIYFLSEAGGIVKLRNDLMDIKLLREVDVYGLERWEPVMKAGFPLSAADVTAGLRGASPRPADFFAANLERRRLHPRLRRGGRAIASSIRAQEEGSLLARRVHGRTVGRGSGRQAHCEPSPSSRRTRMPSSLW